ncbi:MAG: O-methyltransferase [Paramuribaculum sp.]|nr:O-methyltransferase [Paramuribaculum sp.]
MQREIDEYITAHTSPEPGYLKELYRHTWLHRLYPQMCSGHVQGRILKMLTAMVNPRYVLELGTFTGYSALCIAEALQPGAEIHTIEIDDESADSLIELFKNSPGGEKITLHVGDALEIIPELNYCWDMVYIDANKRHYCEYLDEILPRLKTGGFIIADNTLWGGKITEGARDAQSVGIARFNDLVANHPQLEVVILPLRDGLTLLRKTD